VTNDTWSTTENHRKKYVEGGSVKEVTSLVDVSWGINILATPFFVSSKITELQGMDTHPTLEKEHHLQKYLWERICSFPGGYPSFLFQFDLRE